MIRKLFIYLFRGTFLRFFKSEVYRSIQFVGEYEKMIQRINKGIFIREKLKEGREEIRREYDKINEDLDATKIAQEKNKDNSELKEKLDKLIEGKTKDIEQLKLQIDQLDKQISEPGGVEETIESYRAILPLIERLVKKGE